MKLFLSAVRDNYDHEIERLQEQHSMEVSHGLGGGGGGGGGGCL